MRVQAAGARQQRVSSFTSRWRGTVTDQPLHVRAILVHLRAQYLSLKRARLAALSGGHADDMVMNPECIIVVAKWLGCHPADLEAATGRGASPCHVALAYGRELVIWYVG
jgi:hypothetical protein